jgi:hypothetical protein
VLPLIYRAGALALLGVVVAGLLIRLRRTRDRRMIAADLETRRCRLVRATPISGRRRRYQVEYLDDEADPTDGTCTIARGGVISWGDDFADAPDSVGFAHNLPTYGQNWRG